jgi:hypothetical protein
MNKTVIVNKVDNEEGKHVLIKPELRRNSQV